ncbi:hypothetical protein [Azonexus fungiphilus]|nr:hypothetical protein [Azonexus fungiphilus]
MAAKPQPVASLMPRPPFLAACTALALLCALPATAPAACADLPPSTLKVVRVEREHKLNFSYGHRTLRNLGDDHQRRDIAVLGLARGVATAKAKVSGKIFPAGDRRHECASFAIEVEYGFDPVTVYVGREFPPGTCGHDEIYRHELRHVEVYRAQARAIEAEITQALQQRFARETPWYAPAGTSVGQLRQELDQRWMPYIVRLLDQSKAAQRAIDSPEEYARIEQSCAGEIRRVIDASR